MITTQQITTLCDADMRKRWGMLQKVSKWITVARLRREYDYQQWLTEAQEAMCVMGEGFQKTTEKMYEAFRLSLQPITPIGTITKFRARRGNFNNYRKLHALPMIRRQRCRRRWRPRESRRKLDGLSPGVVVVDEFAFADKKEMTT